MTIPDSGYMMENGAIGIPFTLEEEKRIVTELTNKAESNLKQGNLYYVISNRWFTTWQKYTGQDVDAYLFDKYSTDSQSFVLSKPADRPGPIDNSDIVLNANDTVGDDLELHRTLEEGCDYVLVPQLVWGKLFDWYKGGPALPRKLISQGDVNKQFNVEVYPLCLRLIDSRDNSQSVISLSKKVCYRLVVLETKSSCPEFWTLARASFEFCLWWVEPRGLRSSERVPWYLDLNTGILGSSELLRVNTILLNG